MHLLVGGPARAWNVFLACEDQKKPWTFEMHTCLWPGRQIWFRRKGRNWLHLLFYFIVLIGIVPSVIGRRFFNSVPGFRLKFSRIALWRKRLLLDSKSELTTNGLILGFFVGKWLLSSTSYLYGMKSARVAQLLFFSDDTKFFRCLVWGVFWSVL